MLMQLTIVPTFVACRMTLETTGNLEPWVSALDEQFDEQAIEAEADQVAAQAAALEANMKREAEAEAVKARDQVRSDLAGPHRFESIEC